LEALAIDRVHIRQITRRFRAFQPRVHGKYARSASTTPYP
jgi:hypothetical protein